MCDKVRVAIRVRPFNRREVDLDTQSVVHIQDNRTVLHSPAFKNNRSGVYTTEIYIVEDCLESICLDRLCKPRKVNVHNLVDTVAICITTGLLISVLQSKQ